MKRVIHLFNVIEPNSNVRLYAWTDDSEIAERFIAERCMKKFIYKKRKFGGKKFDYFRDNHAAETLQSMSLDSYTTNGNVDVPIMLTTAEAYTIDRLDNAIYDMIMGYQSSCLLDEQFQYAVGELKKKYENIFTKLAKIEVSSMQAKGGSKYITTGVPLLRSIDELSLAIYLFGYTFCDNIKTMRTIPGSMVTTPLEDKLTLILPF